MKKEPITDFYWNPGSESLNSYMFKIEEWRSWYSNLTWSEKIEFKLKDIDPKYIHSNNISIVELARIKGEKYVKDKYGVKVKNKSKKEDRNEPEMPSLQQTFEGF